MFLNWLWVYICFQEQFLLLALVYKALIITIYSVFSLFLCFFLHIIFSLVCGVTDGTNVNGFKFHSKGKNSKSCSILDLIGVFLDVLFSFILWIIVCVYVCKINIFLYSLLYINLVRHTLPEFQTQWFGDEITAKDVWHIWVCK